MVNVGWFFISHRLPIAIAARKAGYEVHVATALDSERDQNTRRILQDNGIILHTMKFSRKGMNPFGLLRDMHELTKLFHRVQPDVVHLVTLKPILLGGLAARLARLQAVVLAIPGRGPVFSAKGLVAVLRRWIVLRFMRLAYRPVRTTAIVQNREDLEFFVNLRIFDRSDISLIRGSGVDLDRFSARPENFECPTVVLASRMLREKGIADFIAAAQYLKAKGIVARFILVGEPDLGNADSYTREDLVDWAASGMIEWKGFYSDMPKLLADSHVVCLPTYYGEGVPKVLIEAAASGRPIVTTDIPGCHDIVRHGVNGLLIRPRDVGGLSLALERLISDANLRQKMGENGRRLAEAEFGIAGVVAQTLKIYETLLASSREFSGDA